MKNISLSLPLLLLSTLLLTACATPPNSLQLAPQLDDTSITTQVKSAHSWQLTSQDLRTARYLIAISSGDDVATLVNESSSTRAIVEQTLQAHWLKQGHTFSTDSANNYQIDIQLIKLLAQVEQGAVSHESDINVVLKVQLSNAHTTFSKTFRSNFKEEAPFNASVDKLTEQLNTQLSQLLNQVVQDSELNAKLLQL